MYEGTYVDESQGLNQVCQMVSFQTKNHNLGKFWLAIDWKLMIYYGHLEYFTDIWDVL
jgi:hypothetical protein